MRKGDKIDSSPLDKHLLIVGLAMVRELSSVQLAMTHSIHPNRFLLKTAALCFISM